MLSRYRKIEVISCQWAFPIFWKYNKEPYFCANRIKRKWQKMDTHTCSNNVSFRIQTRIFWWPWHDIKMFQGKVTNNNITLAKVFNRANKFWKRRIDGLFVVHSCHKMNFLWNNARLILKRKNISYTSHKIAITK